MEAWRVLQMAAGSDHPWTLLSLRAWVELDPSSDEALAALVSAYRRQLLRIYVRVPRLAGVLDVWSVLLSWWCA
jgi:hypothetical protein